MIRYLLMATVMLLVPWLLPPQASRANAQDFPSGWTAIPNTKMRAVCPPSTPDYDFAGRCKNVILAWNGGVVDSTRDRLIMWGGGHNDYAGNELYALDLATRTIQRLTDPSPPNLPIGTRDCQETLADGRPNSRHSYGGMAYIAHADRLFVYGGSLACGPGHFSRVTWTFHFPSLIWQRMDPSGPQPGPDAGVVAAYDPNSKKVYLHDSRDLYAYTFETNSYDRLASDNFIDYHMTSAVDPVRSKLVIIGGPDDNNGGVSVYDIGPGSSFIREKWPGTPLLANNTSPGLAYDPDTDRMIVWSGGDIVYFLDTETRSWSSATVSGGPGAASPNGMFGRLGHVPGFGLLVTVTDVDEDAYVLRPSAALLANTRVWLNGTRFGSGQTLSLGLSVHNPDASSALDLYVGALLPDRKTLVLFSGHGVLERTGSLSAPTSLSPMQVVPPGFQLDASSFFQYIFPPAGVIASGVYRVFSALIRPGSLNDNAVDLGDIVALSVAELTFSP